MVYMRDYIIVNLMKEKKYKERNYSKTMETEVIYFILGIVLGLGVGIYFYEQSRERAFVQGEKFVSKNLKLALDNSSNIIYKKIKELKRDLTEVEKDEIIRDCYDKTKQES